MKYTHYLFTYESQFEMHMYLLVLFVNLHIYVCNSTYYCLHAVLIYSCFVSIKRILLCDLLLSVLYVGLYLNTAYKLLSSKGYYVVLIALFSTCMSVLFVYYSSLVCTYYYMLFK